MLDNSNLDLVTEEYRKEFLQSFDQIFALFQDEFESYMIRSEEMRQIFAERGQGFVILLRDGGFGRVNPLTEGILPIDRKQLPRLGVYQE